MAAMILFSAFCVSGILFLVAFFVALCRDGKKSRRPQYVAQGKTRRVCGCSICGPHSEQEDSSTGGMNISLSCRVETKG